MAKQKDLPPQASPLAALLGVALLASLAGNVAMGMQLTKPSNSIAISPQTSVRSVVSGEDRLASGEMSPEYDYAFGMRKNMQLTKENCLLDECFLQLNLKFPVGTLPEGYGNGLKDILKKEREIGLMLNSVRALQPDSALLHMRASQDIRVAALGFLGDKYGVTPQAVESGVSLTNAAEACQQVSAALAELEKSYNTELARTDIASYPDVDYAYRQLVTQTRTVHRPLAQCR